MKNGLGFASRSNRANLNSIRHEYPLVVVTFILALIYPVTVTWDGYLYLGSGLSLFTEDFVSNYHWLREPGYPLIIKTLYAFGGFKAIVICQSLILLHTVILMGRVSERFSQRLGLNISSAHVYFAKILALCIGFGYAATLLQQIFFAWFVILSLEKITNASDNRKFEKLKWVSLGILSSSISLLLASGILFALCVFFACSKKIGCKPKSYLVTFFALGLVLFTLPWYSYKASLDLSTRIYKDNIFLWEKSDVSGQGKPYDIFGNIESLPTSILALNSAGFRKHAIEPIASENRIFGSPRFEAQHACGRFYPGPEVYLSKVQLPNSGFCVSNSSIQFLFTLNTILYFLIPLVGIAGIVGLIILALRLRIETDLSLVVFVPILTQAPYLLFGDNSISRYGFPNLIFSPFAFTLAAYVLRTTKIVKIIDQ